jgi:O-antigen/teichoic acid export membrane protein
MDNRSKPERKVLKKLDELNGRLRPKPVADFLLAGTSLARKIIDGNDDRSISQRTVVFVFAIRVFSAVIAYLSQVLLARWIGEFEYGIFVAVWVGVLVLGCLSCMGVQAAIIRFISEYMTLGRFRLLRGVLLWSFMFCLSFSTVLAVSGALVVHHFADSIASVYVAPILLAALCVPMVAMQELQDGIARAFDLPGTAIVPTFILRPVMILVIVGIFILSGIEPDACATLIAAIVATWMASILQFIFLALRLSKIIPEGSRAYRPGKWLMISLPILLVEGFYGLLTNTDILFVSYYMAPDEVAVYFAAVKTLALAHFVYFAVRAGSTHRIAAYRAAGDREQYERFIRETIHWTFWPSLVFAVAMVGIGKYFLLLFGPAFVEGADLLWILALGVMIRASVGAAESVLTMSGEQKNCALIYGLTFAVNVVLNWALIPVYGLHGAAIATTAAMAFEAAALYAAAKRKLDLHIFVIPARRHLAEGAA